MSIPLPSPDRTAFFLDFDGTLAEIAPEPGAARLTPPVRATLEKLSRRSGGALALVSGRRIADLDRLVAPLRLPAAGVHGAERRRGDGSDVQAAVNLAAMAEIQRRLLPRLAAAPALHPEFKNLSLALHYRAAPELAAVAQAAAAAAIRGFEADFVLQPGKMLIEIRPRSADKGKAVEAFLGEAPFAGRLPLYAGDDATDEDAFVVVNRRGGLSIKVGGGPTAARHRLPDPGALAAWLEGTLQA